MEARLANPRGFCAGVDRAIEIVERALELYGAPIYVLHEIVHNKHVLEDLSARGAVFVQSLAQVPEGAVTIFSAHGVSAAVVAEGAARHLRVIDATCPLVTKVHLQARQYADEGREVILIGHPGHPEVEGTRGRIPGRVHVLSTVEEVVALTVSDPTRLSYVTQTTLSVDDTRAAIEALVRRFPLDQGPRHPRHLLRHPEPADRGQAPGARDRPATGGGLGQQLQLDPPAGARRSLGDPLLPRGSS